MAFQTWLPTQARSETQAAPFQSASFPLQPNDGYIVFHLIPQGVLGVAGQEIHWWVEARKTGGSEFQQVVGATVKCEFNSNNSKSGFFGGEVSLYGEEFDAVRGAYYTVNGPITFGVEGDIRAAQRGKKK